MQQPQALVEELAALKRKIAQLEARIARKEAKLSGTRRRLDTRRKIILGGYVLAFLEKTTGLPDYLQAVMRSPDLREAERLVIAAWLKEVEAK
jgi:molecular chaperone GrpE (heat shock protein)